MTRSVLNLFIDAMANREFEKDLIIHEPNFKHPSLKWGNLEKITYATIYMGWLIGKGIYNENYFK